MARLWASSLLLSWLAVVSAVRVQQPLIRPAEEKACESLKGTRSQEFLTEKIKFRPGDVHNLFYFVDAPLGRFATRDFLAEMVLEDGTTSVPLFETYLHHWLMYEYAIPKTDRDKHKKSLMAELRRNPEAAVLKGHKHRNEKALKDYPWAPDTWFLIQQFGVGAETRHTNTSMPIPYGFEGGDRFGEEYDSVWVLNVHAIDTRGAVETMACTECRSVPLTISLKFVVCCSPVQRDEAYFLRKPSKEASKSGAANKRCVPGGGGGREKGKFFHNLVNEQADLHYGEDGLQVDNLRWLNAKMRQLDL